MSVKFQIRLSEEQRKRWKKRAQSLGLDVSTWLRQLADADSLLDIQDRGLRVTDRLVDKSTGETVKVTVQQAIPNPFKPEHTPPTVDFPRGKRNENIFFPRYNPATDSYELADKCPLADSHWRLKRGERCATCKGIA